MTIPEPTPLAAARSTGNTGRTLPHEGLTISLTADEAETAKAALRLLVDLLIAQCDAKGIAPMPHNLAGLCGQVGALLAKFDPDS